MEDFINIEGLARIAPFRLRLWFSDGTAGDWDFSELATREPGPMVEPFKDPAFFNRVFVEFGGLTWPNGCDIDPINAQMTMREAGTLRPASAAA